jgi:hypothetical protein
MSREVSRSLMTQAALKRLYLADNMASCIISAECTSVRAWSLHCRFDDLEKVQVAKYVSSTSCVYRYISTSA